MSIVFKYLWKSFIEKKGRMFLFIFSIAAASALIFANEGFRRTCEYMFIEAGTRYAGNSNIVIETKKEVGASAWIDTSLLDEYINEFEYAYGFILENALYSPNIEDMTYFNIYGVDMGEFQKHNPFGLKSGSFEDWNGYKVVMGDAYASKYGFSVGDSINLELNGVNYEFIVSAVAKQEGIYSRELADGGIIFAPKEILSEIFGIDANLVYIKVKDIEQLENVKERVSERLSQYNVSYTVDDSLIAMEVTNYVLPFQISSLAVIFMSIFIIYTSFGLITTKRISAFGTFRSLGLTRKKLNKILLVESTVIGAIGGLVGCVFGILVLYFIKNSYFKTDGSFANSAPVVFGIKEIIIAVGIAVLITSGSGIVSIRKATKKQIKEIILHQPEEKMTKKSKLWLIGIAIFIICTCLPYFLPKNLVGTIFGGIIALSVLLGLVWLLPGIVGILAKLADRMGLSQEIYLGFRNVRDHKTLMGNLRLYSAIIAIVAFMVSVFNTMSKDLHRSWDNDYRYDVSFTMRTSDQDTLNKLKNVDGVKDAVGYYINSESTITDDKVFLNMLYGIEDATFFDMNIVGGLDKIKQELETLNDGNYLITTNILKTKLGLEIGDVVKVNYHDKVYEFVITGFVDTNLGIGHVAYIGGDNYRELIGTKNYDNFLVRGTSDPDTLKLNIKRTFTKDILQIHTKLEQKQANADKVDSIFNAISIYTYFAVGIGMLGMLNNVIAGFMERKKSLALYQCIGMSKKGISKMMLTEAVVMGILGSALGMFSAAIMMGSIPLIVGIMWGNVEIQPATRAIIALCISGTLGMMLVSALPLRSSKTINIIENIKYE